MSNKDTLGDDNLGASRRRLGELHVLRARTAALRLYGLCSAMIPAPWDKVVQEEIYTELSDFSYHCRRLIDLSGMDVPNGWHETHAMFGNIENLNYDFEPGFRFCLNHLHHATGFAFVPSKIRGQKRWENIEAQHVTPFVISKTDTRGAVAINIVALVVAFLTEGLSDLKMKCPEWRF